MLLNMETPERKPASSTAKRPRVRQSAVTSLRRGQDQAGSGLPKDSADPCTPTPPPGAHWTSCFSYSSGVNWRGRQAWMLLSWRAGQEKRKEKKVKRRDWAAGTGRGGPGGTRDPGEEGARAERGPLQAEKRRARALPCPPVRPRLTRDQKSVMTTTR